MSQAWWVTGKQPSSKGQGKVNKKLALLRRATTKASSRLDAQGFEKKGNRAPPRVTLPNLKCLSKEQDDQ